MLFRSLRQGRGGGLRRHRHRLPLLPQRGGLHECTYTHNVSQILIEKYLLDNLENEFQDFCFRNVSVNASKKIDKKKRSAKQINTEIERLNFMFQKDRISFEYYNDQYEKLNRELDEIRVVVDYPAKDYSYLKNLFQSGVKNVYDALDLEGKQAFWHDIIREIHIDENHQIDRVDFL